MRRPKREGTTASILKMLESFANVRAAMLARNSIFPSRVYSELDLGFTVLCLTFDFSQLFRVPAIHIVWLEGRRGVVV